MARKVVALPRETVESKGRRYLTEGRLVVDRVSELGVRARCRGGGQVYEVGLDVDPGLRWWCTCPAVGRCGHLVALQLVVVGRRSEEQAARG